MKKLLVLSDDNIVKNSFIDYYKDSSFYYVDFYERNNVNINDYDGIIIDFFMNNNKWLSIMKEVNRNKYIFIILPDLNINLNPILNQITINYIFHKPLCMYYVEEILNSYYYDGVKTYLSFKRELFIVFKELGLSFKLLGTKYLFYMLSLVLCDNKEIDMNLYLLTSNHYNVPEDNVIKDISYAVLYCFNKTENDLLKEKIFGYSSSKNNGSMTNLNFIYNIYVYILYCVSEEEFIKK